MVESPISVPLWGAARSSTTFSAEKRGANRIANGSFELDGESFKLDANNGSHHLHGGRAFPSRRVSDQVAMASSPKFLTWPATQIASYC